MKHAATLTAADELFQVYGVKHTQVIAWIEQKETEEKEYVFRPLAGTDIDTAAEQSIKKVQNGENIVLAFNGVYIPIKKNYSIDNIVTEYYLGIKEVAKAEKTVGEMSEDDKRRFKNLCDIINDAKGWNDVSKKSFISWIKSFFQPNWKPSEEQLKELKSIASGKAVFSKEFIKTLYDNLKKL